MWAALVWIGKVAIKVTLWALAHPIVATAVGAGAAAAGAWLREQPWMGSDVLGRIVGAFGLSVLATGLGAWVGGKLFTGPLEAIGRTLLGGASWWQQIMSASPATTFWLTPGAFRLQ